MSYSINKKTDPVTNLLERVAHWVFLHWQQAILACGAIIVAAFLSIVVVYNLKRLRFQAWDQYALANTQMFKGENQKAIETLTNILNSHRTGALASQSGLLKGDIYFKTGKKEEAIKAYQDTFSQADNPELRAMALFNIAAAFEESQNWTESENHYQQFIDEYAENYLNGKAYESLGRVQMAQNKYRDAQGTFERLIALYPDSNWSQKAESYLAHINPHLPKAGTTSKQTLKEPQTNTNQP